MNNEKSRPFIGGLFYMGKFQWDLKYVIV